MGTTKNDFRLDSFGLKDHLEAMTERHRAEAFAFAREVITDGITTGMTVEDVVERVQREVMARAVQHAALINLDGGSFTGVMEDAAVARGWAEASRELTFTAKNAVVAMASRQEPTFVL